MNGLSGNWRMPPSRLAAWRTSGGLEAASKWGEFNEMRRLEDFLHVQLTQTAHALIPPLRAAWESPAQAMAMDQVCQAFISNHVANRASRAQGKAFLLSADRGVRLVRLSADAR